jgi:hypothetical protein
MLIAVNDRMAPSEREHEYAGFFRAFDDLAVYTGKLVK